MKNKFILKILVVSLCAFLTCCAVLFCISFGSTGFSLDIDILNIRIPRVLGTALVGAILSVCGCAMQGLLRNPLADGTTLGVCSGGSLGAVIAICLLSSFGIAHELSSIIVPAISIGFSVLSLFLIMFLAYKKDYMLSTNTIILIGIVFTMFASSLISFMVTMFPEDAKTILFWTMGSTATITFENLLALLIVFVPGSIVLLFNSSALNILTIGEQKATQIGMSVKKTKIVLMITTSLMIGVCVSFCGTIGFVGLIVPHILRLVFGPNHKKLIPASIILQIFQYILMIM